MAKRQYKMQKRAEDQARTRLRIVEATVELHGSVGPKNTTVSAVARRAGVRRVTVYNHFPDEFALFSACSAHWLDRNPPPDPATWMGIADPAQRTGAALSAIYGYYRSTSSMLKLIFRDIEEVEAMRAPVEAFLSYLEAIQADLVSAWHPRGRKPQRLSATIAHALSFSTWLSLSELGLSDQQARRLAVDWIKTSV